MSKADFCNIHIYSGTIEKDLKGEDFVDAIRILIQATETAIWFHGHNIQIISGFKIL